MRSQLWLFCLEMRLIRLVSGTRQREAGENSVPSLSFASISEAETCVGQMGCGDEGDHPSDTAKRPLEQSWPPYPQWPRGKEAFLLSMSSNLLELARRVPGCKCVPDSSR